jgi:hypothetical protein
MIRLSDFPPRDLELLSAYLDGELTAEAAQKVEQRLREEDALRWALTELRSASRALKSLPEVRRPRSLTLSPEMAGMKPARFRYPLLQLGTVLATLALMLTLGLDAVGSMATRSALAPLSADNARALSQGQPAPTLLAAGEAASPEAEMPMLQAQEQPATPAPEATGEAPLLAPSGISPCPEGEQACTPGPEIGGGGGLRPEQATPSPEFGIGGGPPPAAGTPSQEFGVGGGPAPEATAVPTEQPLAAAPPMPTAGPAQEALSAAPTQAKAAPPAAAVPEAQAPFPSKGPLRLAEALLALSALIFGGLTYWQLRRH